MRLTKVLTLTVATLLMAAMAGGGLTEAASYFPEEFPEQPPPAQTVDPGLFLLYWQEAGAWEPHLYGGQLTPKGETVPGNKRWLWEWRHPTENGHWANVLISWNATPPGGGVGRWDVAVAYANGSFPVVLANGAFAPWNGNGAYAVTGNYNGVVQTATFFVGVTFYGVGRNDGADWSVDW